MSDIYDTKHEWVRGESVQWGAAGLPYDAAATPFRCYGDLGRAIGELGALLNYLLQKIQEHELRIARLARQRSKGRKHA